MNRIASILLSAAVAVLLLTGAAAQNQIEGSWVMWVPSTPTDIDVNWSFRSDATFDWMAYERTDDGPIFIVSARGTWEIAGAILILTYNNDVQETATLVFDSADIARLQYMTSDKQVLYRR